MASRRVSLDEVLKHCEASYQAVDLRIAAAIRDGEWRVHSISIRLDFESPELIRQRHEYLLSRYPAPNEDVLRVLLDVQSIDCLDSIIEGLAAGGISVHQENLTLVEPIDLRKMLAYVSNPRSNGTIWPMVWFVHSLSPVIDLASAQVTASNHSYETPEQVIAKLLGLASAENQFRLECPIYARYCEPTYDEPAHQFAIPIYKHPNLQCVDLHVNHVDGSSERRRPLTKIEVKAQDDDLKEHSFVEFRQRCELDDPCLTDAIDSRLTHRILGELDNRVWKLKELVPVSKRNLLVAAFAEFCSLEELSRLLGKPSATKRDQSGRAFELYVSWLLSLVGCPNVLLDEKEYLYVGRRQCGSADALALLDEDTLLVISVTLRSPTTDKFEKLIEAVTELRSRLNLGDSSQEIIAVLACGAPYTHTTYPFEDNEASSGPQVHVNILDVGSLRELLNDAKAETPTEMRKRLRTWIC